MPPDAGRPGTRARQRLSETHDRAGRRRRGVVGGASEVRERCRWRRAARVTATVARCLAATAQGFGSPMMGRMPGRPSSTPPPAADRHRRPDLTCAGFRASQAAARVVGRTWRWRPPKREQSRLPGVDNPRRSILPRFGIPHPSSHVRARPRTGPSPATPRQCPSRLLSRPRAWQGCRRRRQAGPPAEPLGAQWLRQAPQAGPAGDRHPAPTLPKELAANDQRVAS